MTSHASPLHTNSLRDGPVEEDPLRLDADTDTSPVGDAGADGTRNDSSSGRHFPQHPTLTRGFYPHYRRDASDANMNHQHSSLTPQEIEHADMVDDSSSNWVDIVDPASDADEYSNNNSLLFRLWQRLRGRANNNNNNTEDSGSRRRRRRCSTIKLQLPCLLCDCVAFFWDWTFAAVELWMEVLTAPPFPIETLQKVSIVLLGVEVIRDNIDHSALLVALVNTNNAATTNGNNINGDANQMVTVVDGVWTLASIPQYLVWGVPAVIGMLSASFVLTLQLTWGHQEEAVIATALILLIFLEALLPIFILGCTSMFLFQQVSWETGLALLLVVWLGSTFCAHCIRRMLYQSLGHG